MNKFKKIQRKHKRIAARDRKIVQDREDGKELDPPEVRRKTMAQQRYSAQRDFESSQRLLNDMRRKRTLARAAIPRNHRYFKHTTEEIVLDPMSKQSKPKTTPQFKKLDPAAHSKKHLREVEEQIEVTDDEKERDTLCQYRAVFEANYSMYATKMNGILAEAKRLDEERTKQKKEKMEKKKEAKEAMSLSSSTSSSSSSASGITTKRKKRTRNTAITSFFSPVKGRILTKAEKFYLNFYHDNIVWNVASVTIPDIEQTGILETECASDEDEGSKKKKRMQSSNVLEKDEYTCPNCDKETLFTDAKTKRSVCHSCGTIFASENQYARSFAEMQASSIRNTMPYERISHVSYCCCCCCSSETEVGTLRAVVVSVYC